jgi:Tol biopolymer transport system component
VLPEQFSQNPDLKQRFEREARAISSLNHPNICTLYDVGHQDGMDYLVLEYIEGESLAERLPKGPLPVEQVLKTGAEIAEALEKAHRQGIVHRDLKPGNIMLTKSGAKLLDFGLAKPQAPLSAATSTAAVTQTSPASPITVAGTIVGTFQYMSPEQVEGKEADARSDIFALGAVLYEMVTGKRAFEGKSAISVASAILEKEPEPVTTLAPMTPPALAHVIKVCLAKDPEERFQTAHDVKLQLKWILEGGSSAVGMPAVKSARRKHREWLAWGLAALLALAGVAAGWWLHAPQAPEVMRSSVLLPPDSDTVAQDSSLAFSPDGHKLALELAGADGKTQIWVRSLDSLTLQPLAGTQGGTDPTWSPDGRFLAFFAEHKLKKIDVSGGTVQTICDGEEGRGIAWGPDGTIVFAPGPFTGLFVVAAAGGTPSELTHPAVSGETHRLPQFLPDGDHVLYFEGALSGKDNAIRAISLKTRQVVEILKPAESGPRYVPGYLIFMREQNLMAQPFDARSLKLTGEAVPIAEKVQYNTFRWTGSYAVWETGLLAYRQQAGAGKFQLTWMDLEGKELGKVGEPLSLNGLTLAPDAKHAVLLQPDPGQSGISKLWMYDLERGVMSRFTFGPGNEQGAVWSPDGTQVAYAANRGQGNAIYIKAASGSTPEQLVYRSDDLVTPSSWSPDGKFLACDVLGGQNKNGALWMLPMTGEHKAFRLHPAATANETGANFSQDGRWLSYVSDESGVPEMYVVPFPGPGGKWQVSQGGGNGGWLGKDRLLWINADARLMAATATAKGADLQIGAPQTLLGGKSLSGTGPGDTAHDGKRFLVAMPAGARNINPSLTLVSHWTAELKK